MKGMFKSAVRAAAVGALCLAVGACSGDGKSSKATSGTSPLAGKVDVLALILSSDGQPVENALIGRRDAVSTEDGIIAGTATPPDSGWVSVNADGYATGYMKRSGKPLKGWYIYEAHLTPIESAAIFEGDGGTSLIGGDTASPAVRVDVGSGAFSTSDVIVEMAVMSPADVGPAFAPLSDASGLYLNEGLFVSARNARGDDVPLASGQGLRATVRDDGGLGEGFALARFDAEGGQWAVQSAACKRSDKSHIQCVLPRAGTYGLFGRSAPAAGTGNAYRDALRGYRKAVGDWLRDKGAHGAPGEAKVPPSAVREAGLALIKAARAYAGDHHDERGQMHLINTAAQIRMLGTPAVGRDLIDDARKYVKEAAQELFGQATNCARIRTLLDTAAKADLLGMDQIRHDLIFKARNSYGACDVWAGTVRYTFFMEKRGPGDSGYLREAGPQLWSEEHRVKILVSPMSRKTHGTDRVRIAMPRVTYRRRFDNECGDKNYEQREVYAEPATGTIQLIFDGMYDYVRDRFRLSVFKPQASDTLPRVMLRRRSRVWSGKGCQVHSSDTASVLVKDYSSMLTEAFDGKPGEPSVQEMLNEGERHKLGNGRVVQGGRLITVEAPPKGLPFTRARISWHLINVPPTP